jgi:[ribosomal protein S18]-alanine N-acetyltransferase
MPELTAMLVSPLRIAVLDHSNKQNLLSMLEGIKKHNESNWFQPHSFDIATLENLCLPTIANLHYVLGDAETVFGYGLLRGWDEGFTVPSLGVAIDRRYRRQGLGGLFMYFLHAAARCRGATQVRLRVSRTNAHAHSLYLSMGYIFDPKLQADSPDLLTGIKSLS